MLGHAIMKPTVTQKKQCVMDHFFDFIMNTKVLPIHEKKANLE